MKQSTMDVQRLQNSLLNAVKLQKQGKLNKAKKLYHDVLIKSGVSIPEFAGAWVNFGLIEEKQGNVQKALLCFDKGIALQPRNTKLLFNKARILEKYERYDDGIQNYKRIISIEPKNVNANYQLGRCLYKFKKIEEAKNYFHQVLDIEPRNFEAFISIGECYFEQRQYKAAIQSFTAAASIDPTSEDAYSFLGTTAKAIDDIALAVQSFKKATLLKPMVTKNYIQLANCYLHNCYWDDLTETLETLELATNEELKQKDCITLCPFSVQGFPWSPERKLIIAKSRSKYIEEEMTKVKKKIECKFTYPQNNSRIRIGYLSSDLRNHTVGHLIQGLFENHNRSEFEIFAYSTTDDDGTSIRKRIEKGCDHFVDIKDLSIVETARRINDDSIDILVDLNGYTSQHRLDSLALRPAPIQVHYLGFLGTLGANFIDYLITDEIVCPQDSAPLYSEKFIYMPDNHQVNSHQHPIAETPTREEFGLPEDAFVYCCFNNSYKIDPSIYELWMNILKQKDNAVLWLLKDTDTAQKNLVKETIKLGVDPSRVIFAGKISRDKHLARHRLADLYLDTPLANARTSAGDALWAGLPLLTCPGDYFSNRIGASLLNAIGLPEMIADNMDEYFKKALYYAEHCDELNKIKERLAANRDSYPLYDTKLFTKNLEIGFKKAMENYRAKKPLANIRIVDYL